MKTVPLDDLNRAKLATKTYYKSLSPYVRLEEGVLKVANVSPDGKIDSFLSINFNELYLPKTYFSTGPVSVGSRTEICQALFEVATRYAHSVVPTKSMGATLACIVKSLLRVIEYAWLRGRYAFSDWSVEFVQELAVELKRHGWAGALQLRSRAKEFCSSLSPEQAACFIRPAKRRDGTASLRSGFASSLGTTAHKNYWNFIAIEVVDRARMVGFACRVPKNAFSNRTVLTILNAIVMLSDIKNGISFSFTPMQLGNIKIQPQGRTKNMGPSSLGALLEESQRWEQHVAPSLIGLWEDVLAAAKKMQKCSDFEEELKEAINSSSHTKSISDYLGFNIRSLKGNRSSPDALTVNFITQALATSCFITIAAFNGRRKDEVQSKLYGLQDESLIVVDEDMGLYECWFYVEKTYCTRVPFYVNSYTRRAIGILQRLSSIARELILVSRNRSEVSDLQGIFQLPTINVDGSSKLMWYDFHKSRGYASSWFVGRALGDEYFSPHMLRRAYGLLYHYRYEDSTLMGLAQQYGHFDLETVHIYLTDVFKGSAARGADLYAKRSEISRQAIFANSDSLMEQVHEVGEERMKIFVADVLGGVSKFSGGFARLVQRFHQCMELKYDYSVMDRKTQSETLANILTLRGHEFTPFRHGNCTAAVARRNPAAGCASTRTKMVQRENASPRTCANCPYHVLGNSHLAYLEMEIQRQENIIMTASEQSIPGLRARSERENLTKLLSLHRNRLEREDRLQ